MFPLDNDVRNQILNAKGNVVVSASAGTGKTYITVKRILNDISTITNYQTFAAITFTRKAAREIRERLGPNIEDGFVGTNDNFVLTEIIQPFMYDVYGIEFKKEIKPNFTANNAIQHFSSGIERIRDTGFLCKYRNNRKNFAFQLALDILKNSGSARRYFKSRYFRLYIDEYQDSDVDMHNLFVYICDCLEVPLFIVGDLKQSIYGWRGAYSEGFRNLINNPDFNSYNLRHNFRSNIPIQNYSNIFMDEARENIQQVTLNEEVTSYRYRDESRALLFISNWLNSETNCAFLHYRRDVAESWSNKLRDIDLDFVYIPSSPLDHSDLESEHIWIARLLACYILEDRFNEYDFFAEIPFPESYEFKKVKVLLETIKNNVGNREEFVQACYIIYDYLGYSDKGKKIIEEINTLLTVALDKRYIPTYNAKRYNYTSSTIHSSKGLEYEQVIIMANDYNLLSQDDRFLHYVAVSRPKNRLLILIKDDVRGQEYYREIDRVIDATNSKFGLSLSTSDIIKRIKQKDI